MKSQANTNNQPQLESQVFSKIEPVHQVKSESILGYQAKSYVNREDRSFFYGGQERLTLLSCHLQRVRELHEANDKLQRQIVKCEKELVNAEDPLSFHAEIEHCQVMIARNTGEILNIYSMNESRIRRISELEVQNIELTQNMDSIQSKFISSKDLNDRTQHATEFFLNKATYERNVEEIRHLTQG